jgi:hypothetical protein
MRVSGVRSLAVMCRRCRHETARCGIIGDDARPNWREQRVGAGRSIMMAEGSTSPADAIGGAAPAYNVTARTLKLTRFRGHPNICVQGAHDGEDETTLHT